MIAHPTTRQPWLQSLLVLTLSVLVCYSFTTARAQEKEVPPKVREGSTIKPSTPSTVSTESQKKPAMRESEREGSKPSAERDGMKKPSAERDGGTKKPGMRDGEGGAKKPGARDGEGGAKKPGTGDGEKPRTGARDGEGGTKKPGARDGEGGTKTHKGDGDSATSSGETITLHVSNNGETVMVGDKEVAMSGLRGHLSTFLPEHPGAKIIVTGDASTPLGALHNTVDAVRDNGNKNVGIKSE